MEILRTRNIKYKIITPKWLYYAAFPY